MRDFGVLCVGDINLEITMTGLQSLPVLGREILAGGLLNTLGGSTVNTAAGLARLGAKSAFVGRLGRDTNAAFLREQLAGFGVDMSYMTEDPELPSGVTVSLSTGGDRAMVTCLGALGALCASDVPDALLARAGHLHVGGYFLQNALRPGLPDLFTRAHALGLTVSLDTGWDDTGVWDGGLQALLDEVDIFFPNESEALAITGEADVPAAAAALARRCAVVAVKWGKRGAYLHSGDATLRLPAYRATPVDTTGAGDAFNAGFLAAYVRGLSPADCLRHALAAGSISVTRRGSASSCPNLAEVEAMIAQNDTELLE